MRARRIQCQGMAKVAGLGPFGVYASELQRMEEFYTSVLGMTVTDRSDEQVYLSAQPEREHHQLVLNRSAEQKTRAGQISFHVDSLKDLKSVYQQVKAYGCTFDTVVNHGIAFGCYFFDPEGNRIEVYWSTGFDYPQPYADPIDLDASDEVLLNALNDLQPRESTGRHYYGTDAGKRLTVTPGAKA
jgi:catechol 2,3-dioxygenase-like lactoylglutathione lyase family enzyme